MSFVWTGGHIIIFVNYYHNNYYVKSSEPQWANANSSTENCSWCLKMH